MKSKFQTTWLNLEDKLGFFGAVKQFFQGENLPEGKDALYYIGLVEALSATNCEILAKNHLKVKVQAGQTATANFKIINSAVVDWPNDSTIENDCGELQ